MTITNIRVLYSDISRRRRFLRFSLAGLVVAGFYMLTAMLLVEFVQLKPAIAGVVSFLLAIPVSYGLHKLWSFQSRHLHREAIPRFLFIIILGILINSAVIEFTIMVFHFHYIAGQFAGLGCVTALNYLSF